MVGVIEEGKGVEFGSFSPEEVSIRLQLYNVLAAYCRGVDRRDAELLRSCYHEDGIDDHGVKKGTRDEFVDFVMEVTVGPHLSYPDGTLKFRQHSISNFYVIGIKGDLAATETFWDYRCVGTDGNLGFQWGRYVDKFERRDGVWRIAYRWCILEHGTPNTGYDLSLYPAGTYSMDDPSYELLRLFD